MGDGSEAVGQARLKLYEIATIEQNIAIVRWRYHKTPASINIEPVIQRQQLWSAGTDLMSPKGYPLSSSAVNM